MIRIAKLDKYGNVIGPVMEFSGAVVDVSSTATYSNFASLRTSQLAKALYVLNMRRGRKTSVGVIARLERDVARECVAVALATGYLQEVPDA